MAFECLGWFLDVSFLSFFLSFFLQYVPSVVSEAPHGGVGFSMYNDLNVYKKLCTF